MFSADIRNSPIQISLNVNYVRFYLEEYLAAKDESRDNIPEFAITELTNRIECQLQDRLVTKMASPFHEILYECLSEFEFD